jgi:hypothetical protein
MARYTSIHFGSIRLTLLIAVLTGISQGHSFANEWPAIPKITRPKTVIADSDDALFVVLARPTVSRFAPGDRVTFALHFAVRNAKGEPIHLYGRAGTNPPTLSPTGGWTYKIDLQPFFDNLRFTVRTPDGVKHALVPAAPPDSLGTEPGVLHMYTTWFFDLSPDDYGVLAGGQKHTASFKQGESLDLSKPGIYAIQVSGALVHGPMKLPGKPLKRKKTTFTTGAVEVTVDPKISGVRQVAAAAEAALTTGEFAVDKQSDGPYSGVVRRSDYLFENDDGTRRINFTAPSRRWGYLLYAVDVADDNSIVRITRADVGTCVAEGSRIATPAGDVPVESLDIGDVVVAVDLETGRRVRTRIHVIQSHHSPVIEINDRLRVTGGHPLYSRRGWTEAADLRTGDVLRGAEGQWIPIVCIRDIDAMYRVFDLSVGAPHNFLVEGFLAHNKSRLWSANLDDAWFKHFIAVHEEKTRPRPPPDDAWVGLSILGAGAAVVVCLLGATTLGAIRRRGRPQFKLQGLALALFAASLIVMGVSRWMTTQERRAAYETAVKEWHSNT